jgi:tetratricopeptide (TPR) repeat protein
MDDYKGYHESYSMRVRMYPHKKFLICLSLFILLFFGCTAAGADNLEAIDHYNKAVDLAYEGKFLLALNETDQAIRINQNFTLAHVTRAGILNALGRYDESIDASDRAIALNPNQSAAWNNKAFALIHLERFAEGLDAADRATAIDPSLTEAWINKGTALIALGRYQEALAASEEALLLDPSSEEAKKNRETAQEAILEVPATKAPLPIHIILEATGIAGVSLFFLRMRK